MRCFAHRGFAASNPENTLRAVISSVEAGADAIEVDIRRCSSGELVVIHDETVDRVTDASGTVSDLPLDTLQSLDVLDTGAGVPTLSEVVAAVPADRTLNIELKEIGLTDDLQTAIHDTETDILVSSFEREALRDVSDDTDLPTALLTADLLDAIEQAETLDCHAIHPHHQLCDESFVGAAHDAGLAVNAWTVRTEATANRLAGVGVDGLIVDAPAYCRS